MEALQKLLVEAKGHPLPVFSRSYRQWFQGTLSCHSTDDCFCELGFDVPGVGLCRKRVRLSTLASMLRDAIARPVFGSILMEDTDTPRRTMQLADSLELEMDPAFLGRGRGAAQVKGVWMRMVKVLEPSCWAKLARNVKVAPELC